MFLIKITCPGLLLVAKYVTNTLINDEAYSCIIASLEGNLIALITHLITYSDMKVLDTLRMKVLSVNHKDYINDVFQQNRSWGGLNRKYMFNGWVGYEIYVFFSYNVCPYVLRNQHLYITLDLAAMPMEYCLTQTGDINSNIFYVKTPAVQWQFFF